MDPQRKPRWRRRLVVASLVVIAASILLPAGVVESAFCDAWFPIVQVVLVPAFGWTSWPIMGTLVVVLPLLFLVRAIVRWRRARRDGRSVGAVLGAGFLSFLRFALYAYTIFLLLWGFGYRREPIEARWNLGDALPSYEQVRDVQRRLLAVIHRDLPDDADRDEARAMGAVLDAELALVEELEGWRPAAARVKHPPSGTLMAIGIFGIVSPFTLEANVDPALPGPYRVGIGAHELGHVFGYCGEADANLFAFVAGLRAKDRYARYATALSMLRYTVSKKHAADWLWVYHKLPERAKDDMAELTRARKRVRIEKLAKLTSKVNDSYLKTQGVKLGVDDYSRGYTLFVKAFLKGLVELPAAYGGPVTGK